ncbi:MAG: hypothetical protein MUF49_31025 [Oculatellaceae cyanobacterium Prado106]|jgi:hypothetical protein|nr:hypothetical protein [Oculatellaceae cyanobacterium Prado106]
MTSFNTRSFNRGFTLAGMTAIALTLGTTAAHAESLSSELSSETSVAELSDADLTVDDLTVDDLTVSEFEVAEFEVAEFEVADLSEADSSEVEPSAVGELSLPLPVPIAVESAEASESPSAASADAEALVVAEANRAETANSTSASDLSATLPSSSEPTSVVADVETTDATVSPEATEPTDDRVAQLDVDPGRATRSGPSYIGIGGNIGLGGETSLGESSFAIISKIGLARNFSARPAVMIGGNDPTILVPVTIDFPVSSVAESGDLRLDAAPFVGGGVAISTDGEAVVRPLATAGIDIPIADRLTGNAAVNFAFFDDTEIGITLGVGYNF